MLRRGYITYMFIMVSRGLKWCHTYCLVRRQHLSLRSWPFKPRGTACPDDLHFLLPPPIPYFVNLMTGFVDRIIPANHSAGRNMKLPICREMDSQGKATVKHIKTVLSDVVFARWRRWAIRRKSPCQRLNR